MHGRIHTLIHSSECYGGLLYIVCWRNFEHIERKIWLNIYPATELVNAKMNSRIEIPERTIRALNITACMKLERFLSHSSNIRRYISIAANDVFIYRCVQQILFNQYAPEYFQNKRLCSMCFECKMIVVISNIGT